MGILNQLQLHRRFRQGVQHCTFDPEGPGVVRIHLVPPRFRLFSDTGWIVILNGYYLLPLGSAWALLLSNFMEQVRRFDGKPIGPEDEGKIEEDTLKATQKAFPAVSKAEMKEDLRSMVQVLFAVARGEDPGIALQKLSIRAYADNMTAPHRMDLMVSAMTDSRGCWQCNQKCIFCYAAGQELSAAKELDTQQWKQIIDKLEQARVPMVTFTGGEPTLRKDIAQLVSHAKRMVTRLNTNGVSLTPRLCRELKEAGLDSLQVTLYSHDPNIHNALVGSAHHADTIQGIRNAVQAGLDISVNTPLCQKNADYISTLRLICDLGVRFVTTSGLICTGMAGINHEDYDLSREALLQAVRDAKAFCNDHGMEMDFTSPGLLPADALENLGVHVPMCGACLSNMAIAPDGSVVPCQSWLGSGASLGNLLTDPFRKIWKEPLCQKLRSMNEEEALSCPFRSQKGGAGND